MPDTIALVGGDEFRPGCEDMDRMIMQASGQNPATVMIIPTAAVTDPDKAANNGVTHFAALGAKALPLILNTAQADHPDSIDPVRYTDIVYFTGGDPEHLLAALQGQEMMGSALLRQLFHELDRGLVWAGSSAGAMVLGSVMRRPPLYSDPHDKNRWVEALGLVPNIGVLPHHEQRDPAETLAELQRSAPTGIVYLGIDARTAVIGNPNQWQVAGAGRVTVYHNDDFAVFGPGDQLPTGF